jgi:hypothetical protein
LSEIWLLNFLRILKATMHVRKLVPSSTMLVGDSAEDYGENNFPDAGDGHFLGHSDSFVIFCPWPCLMTREGCKRGYNQSHSWSFVSRWDPMVIMTNLHTSTYQFVQAHQWS